ncbi:4-hydroxybenzoyl-CoA thioesterase [Streptomyces sp. WZ.A104]|uniref:thioesterase family protein n=1 Tax=Streptomyces sp. WZ.A104 TaxID=2023771 RepID=UPI000BBC02AC|nr:thioesterase family protein [Streptomyces sp. WZ.A104]PCG87484.1 4-hydroxybenzoyl-CoA thioesterase [Streptomyces sp. WZ.A104]
MNEQQTPAATEETAVAEETTVIGDGAELPLVRRTVRPEWIDYNGHMSEAFYVLVFGHATDAMMIETGLHAGYRESTGCSLYTVESHIRYLRDVAEGTHLAIRTRLLGTDAKKVRLCHELYALGSPDAVPEPDAAPVATSELLALHVDQQAGRTTPFPEAVRARLAGLTEPAPAWAGRSIAEVPTPR